MSLRKLIVQFEVVIIIALLIFVFENIMKTVWDHVMVYTTMLP